MNICKKRQQVLDANGHILVTGGPGSGKTTIALLKAKRRIDEKLDIGQSILFLSFSRAAVTRILEASKTEIPKSERSSLNIQTFHSFFWEILRGYGYLLGAPKRLTLLAPQDEKALSDGTRQNDENPKWLVWKSHREHLFLEEGKIAFDLFAPKAAEIFSSAKMATLIANRHPLIIVDEAQDTGIHQWECIKILSKHSQIICLADMEQQIFDYLPGIGPERIKKIEADLTPLIVDLGSENNRSPNSEILAFGNDLISIKNRGQAYRGVSLMNCNPKPEHRDRSIRQCIGRITNEVKREIGRPPESIAFLSTFDKGAAIISNALRQGEKPITHKVHFDETATLLSSRFLAFLLEPKGEMSYFPDLATGLELLSLLFRAKGTRTALSEAKCLLKWAETIKRGRPSPKTKLCKSLSELLTALSENIFSGDPRADWMLVRKMLRNSNAPELQEVDRSLEYMMAFNRGKRIASSLLLKWEQYGNYSNAREAMEKALAEDQIISGGEDLIGIHVMTVHKSKAKQFDAVIVFRAGRQSPFVWQSDAHPHKRSRKILRVAVTRAKVHTLILNEAYPPCPILSEYSLSG